MSRLSCHLGGLLLSRLRRNLGRLLLNRLRRCLGGLPLSCLRCGLGGLVFLGRPLLAIFVLCIALLGFDLLDGLLLGVLLRRSLFLHRTFLRGALVVLREGNART